jgi:hypothetical protein
MTTRRLMAAILVLTTFSLAFRSLAFVGLAAYHESTMPHRVDHSYRRPVYYNRIGKVMTKAEVKAARRHKDLSKRYRMAAAWPWFPLDPNLPDPDE